MQQFIHDHLFFVQTACTAVLFLVVGYALMVFPPAFRNWMYGYRTPQSMQSQKKWAFAQRYSGKLLVYAGILLLSGAAVAYVVPVPDQLGTFIAMTSSLCLLALIILRTEYLLRRM